MPFLETDGNARELDEETSIGSGSQAGWRIQSKDLAARHFTIHAKSKGAAKVVPASAQNIVILNGAMVPVLGAALNSGDVIAAGAARFIYLESEKSKRPILPDTATPSFLIDAQNRKAYPLNKRVVQIGREVGCSIVLKDTSVSRFHADVRAEGGEHVLYSSGAGGTRVNGADANGPQMLTEGDQVQVGRTTFTFTKAALPPAMKLVQLEEHADDSFSRRNTQVMQRAITGEQDVYRTPSAPLVPLLVGAVVVLLAVVAFLVMK